MDWSPQQSAALQAIKRWRVDPRAPQVFRVFGFAGTGKTTLAKEVAAGVSDIVLFATFTGKASLVLRSKGCTGATTIHSLIYKPDEDPITGETQFILNPDSDLQTAGLLIVDEVSMVGPDLGADLLSFGTKVLVLGDPAQLPPVSGEGFFTAAEPDVMLTEIHRQAAENPIIRMSMDVREGRQLEVGAYGESRVVRRADLSKEQLRDDVLAADQVLCGMNRTRRTFNARIRSLRGFQSDMPQRGDRLICLKNDRTKGLLNGGMWSVEESREVDKKMEMKVKSLDEPNVTLPVDVKTPVEFFRGQEQSLHWRDRKKADQFDFGNAITVHKSQGSAWPNVLLFDESSAFREHQARHLYTGLTRAAERVTVIV